MKKTYFIVTVGLLILLLACNLANATVTRFIKVGRMWAKILDNAQFAETSSQENVMWYYTKRGFQSQVVNCIGTRFGVENWTDENGTVWPVKLAGAPYGTADNFQNWHEMPYPGEEDLTLKRYWRYTPPTIVVDGFYYQEPFPLKGDEVDPSKIPGTADVMIESYVGTWIGLEVKARTFSWSQKNHDDYILHDWTFTNTGNIDTDDEIELNNTLTGLYVMRQQEIFPFRYNEWSEFYGENISDTLKIMYSSPSRRQRDSEDRYGIGSDRLISGQDRVDQPSQTFVGEGSVLVPKSYTDPTDDPSQPRMHAVHGPDDLWIKQESGRRPESDWLLVYQIMQEGYRSVNPCLYMNEAFPEADVYPNTAHDVEFPKRGKAYMEDWDWWFWHQVMENASGPYDLPIGESLRFVWSMVGGALDPESAWDVYEDWDDGTCTWPAWEAGGANDLGDYYPTFADFPEIAPTANDQAKDRWIATGKDSLFKNNYAAKWAVEHDYNVPIPPPPPSIEVTSLPDRVRVSWGNESESAADFAGYRVYRASGFYHYYRYQGVEMGKWEKIYEVTGTGTHHYDDETAERGTAYYYYVTAFDNGTQNGQDAHGNNEVLESGQYLNMTTAPAYLTRQPGESLEDIQVVPNPYNFLAAEMNYPGEPNKIMFLDLPLECTIKIYTETLDLIKTIDHYGSGDEAWGITNMDHMTTETGQLVVSGLYIALFETPDGQSTIRKFVIVR
ncbi:hypothetical protein JW824_15030 [bacterium]|nr:hypothetical protein [bacterium]